MTVEKLRILTLVQSVLLRPRMYTVTGSLAELLAFFNGCLNRGLNETCEDLSVRSMLQWLKKELCIESEFERPERLYKTAIDHYGDEPAALDAIREQFLDPTDLIDVERE
jgi:hypothetical protein